MSLETRIISAVAGMKRLLFTHKVKTKVRQIDEQIAFIDRKLGNSGVKLRKENILLFFFFLDDTIICIVCGAEWMKSNIPSEVSDFTLWPRGKYNTTDIVGVKVTQVKVNYVNTEVSWFNCLVNKQGGKNPLPSG